MALPALALILAAALHAWDASPTSISNHGIIVAAIATTFLIGAALAALRHAETLGAKLGEPLGTVALTFSVTIIEVAVVASMMTHGENNPTLARQTIFSVVMIVCAGVIGLCLLAGALRYHEQGIQPKGTSSLLAVLIALTVLTLILPNYTVTAPQGSLAPSQLTFVSVISMLLYGSFLFIQTVRHRADFIEVSASESPSFHKPTLTQSVIALVWLLISLFGVVLLSKQVANDIEDALAGIDQTQADAIVGFIIALLILLPESAQAIRAATNNALQTSLNGALGAAIATIGLTVPAVSAVSLSTGREVVFALNSRDAVLLLLTLLLSLVSFGTGRTNVMAGLVHLVVFATFVFLLIVP
jgi:Ca2+:H+ antiporter